VLTGDPQTSRPPCFADRFVLVAARITAPQAFPSPDFAQWWAEGEITEPQWQHQLVQHEQTNAGEDRLADLVG
jgi:hypothetical protein